MNASERGSLQHFHERVHVGRLSLEEPKIKIIFVNHQTHKTRAIAENVHARLQDLTKFAAEFVELLHGETGTQKSWKTSSLCWSQVFSDSVLCVGRRNGVANEEWAIKFSEKPELKNSRTVLDSAVDCGQLGTQSPGIFLLCSNTPSDIC